VWAYCVCYDHAQGPLGRPSTSPGSAELRRSTQTPPLGAFSTAQDSRLSRIYLMEPEPFARGTDGSSLAGRECGPLGLPC
jgi:hypothetical protein